MSAPFRILIVEDNQADADLVREALIDAHVTCAITTVSDGAQALEYLRKDSTHAGTDRPDIVLLDINLPRVDGFEVLREMKADPRLKCIPVLILSSSTAGADVRRGYELHANSYIAKHADVNEFFASIHRLERFWLGTAVLPCQTTEGAGAA